MLGKTGCFTQEENQILYQIFCSSVQEKKKLGIALENILYQEEVEKVIQDTYLNYIKRRYRSAIAFIKEIEQEEFLWNKDIIEDKAVSYTHLDVYKRQVLYSFLWCGI